MGDSMAWKLCTPECFEAFKKLLRVNQTEVAYPTATLLLQLAQHFQAIPLFADLAMLQEMMNMVSPDFNTSPLAQHELAKALHKVIPGVAQHQPHLVQDITASLVTLLHS